MPNEYRTPNAQNLQEVADNIPVFWNGSIAVTLALSVTR
jgi:hypothetical protein